MVTGVNQRVQTYRAKLRRAGLRPVQIWVPDTRRLGFVKECRRQCLAAARADARDTGARQFMDTALTDIEGWSA